MEKIMKDNQPFILVERPHQTPAKAYHYDSIQQFLDEHQEQIACAEDWLKDRADEGEITFWQLIEYLGDDLSAITVLENPEETKRYILEKEYAGHHNKAVDLVYQTAVKLGWIKHTIER